MAMQPRIIACGNLTAAITMTIRFLAGPAFMAIASFAVGIRGELLRIAIVQVVFYSLPVLNTPSHPIPSSLSHLKFCDSFDLMIDLLFSDVGTAAGGAPSRHCPLCVRNGVQPAC